MINKQENNQEQTSEELDYICLKCLKAKGSTGALEFLKKFYKEVWGKYSSYVKNDNKLYDLFDKKNDNCCFITEARVGLLNSMYSTRITNIRKIVEIIKDISKAKKLSVKEALEEVSNTSNTKKALEEVSKNKNEEDEDKVRQEVSFFSKYFHWYFEVNDKKEAQPIYDGNVKETLSVYTSYEQPKQPYKKPKESYEALKDAAEELIKDLGLNDKKEITLEEEFRIDGLPEKISIYRLVDKFLWLSYKFEHGQIKNTGMIKSYKDLRCSNCPQHDNKQPSSAQK